MSERVRRYTPEYFSNDILDVQFSKRPPAVIKQTSHLIDNYFSGLAINKDYIVPYLTKDTLGLIQNIYKGYQHTAELARKKDVKYVSTLLQGNDPINTDPDSEELTDYIEAFNTAHIIFGHIPHRYTREVLPDGFSSTGIMAAPRTLNTFGQRTMELMSGIHDVISFTADQYAPSLKSMRTMRMHAFFKVGAQLPLKETDTKQNYQDILDYLTEHGELPPTE